MFAYWLNENWMKHPYIQIVDENLSNYKNKSKTLKMSTN
jgi:hypothetical protein